VPSSATCRHEHQRIERHRGVERVGVAVCSTSNKETVMAKEKEKKLRFKPTNWDANKLEPEAAPGEYQCVIDKTTLSTNKHQFPMIRLDMLIKGTTTKTKSAKKSKGATVSDFISFFPDGDRRGNMAKRQFRNLCEQLNIGDDVLPAQLASERDFDSLIKALKKKKVTVWVTVEERDGEPRARVNYVEPRGFMAEESDDDEEEEEEEDEDEDEEEEDDEDENEDEDDDDDDDDDEEDEEDEEDEDDDDDDEDEDEDEKPKKKGKKGKK
jgi:hypothetical protein